MNTKIKAIVIAWIFSTACSSNSSQKEPAAITNENGQQVYQDEPYLQDYSIKYYFDENKNEETKLYHVAADRNENIQITSSDQLMFPYNGHLLAPGTLVPEKTYRHMMDKNICGLISYQNQFVYTDDKAIFSNAWAGNLYIEHGLNKPENFAGGDNFDFLISDDNNIIYLNYEGRKIWNSSVDGIVSIKYNKTGKNFLVVTTYSISIFNPQTKKLNQIYKQTGITSATFTEKGSKIVVGTNKGYQWLNALGQPEGELVTKVPWPEITDVEEINGSLWFGSIWGAYRLNKDNKYDYYSSQRWLPDNNVKDIEPGPEGSVLILTKRGLGQICFEEMTLCDKAMTLEKLTRKYFIRYGFSSTGHGMKNGNLSQLTIYDSDNDGLWTGMYLGGQLFRYAVTKDPEAWENCKEALHGI